MTNRDIRVIHTVCDLDHEDGYDGGDCNCSHSMTTNILSIDELIHQDWFVELLRSNGFYSKDEVGMEANYLDRFVYEYGDASFSYFEKSVSNVPHYKAVKSVYQEVIGPERIKAFAKWKKRREEYLANEKNRIKKDMDAKQKSTERKRLKAVEKAKALLEEEGLNVTNK